MSIRKTAALVLALLPAAGRLFAATTFQAAYISPASGPAAGGTAVSLVGNQFQAGAAVTIGGASAGASVTSSTRIGATTPARTAGAVYDVVVTNPGGPSS